MMENLFRNPLMTAVWGLMLLGAAAAFVSDSSTADQPSGEMAVAVAQPVNAAGQPDNGLAGPIQPSTGSAQPVHPTVVGQNNPQVYPDPQSLATPGPSSPQANDSPGDQLRPDVDPAAQQNGGDADGVKQLQPGGAK